MNEHAMEDNVWKLRNLVRADLSRWSGVLDRLAAAVTSDTGSGESLPARSDLTATRDTAQRLVGELSELFGAGFVVAPDAFSDGYGLVWFTRAPDARTTILPLEVDAEFYAYTTAPWWIAAMSRAGTCATGPYVDASGTGEHIVTLSTRIDGVDAPIGVAGLDIRVSWLQDHLHPLLCRLPPGSSITDEDGGVLATNLARLLGRRRNLDVPADRIVELPPTNWLLVVGGETGEVTSGDT